MNRRWGTFAIWLVLSALAVVLALTLWGPTPLPYSADQFRQLALQGVVSEVRVDGDRVEFTLDGGATGAAPNELDSEVLAALARDEVELRFDAEDAGGLGEWLPTLLLVAGAVAAFLYWLRKRAGVAGFDLAALRRSRHQVVTRERGAKFADVGGCEAAKAELADVVDFLANPGRWSAAGVRAPRAVLLEGPPGCGKTLLARAVAGETGAKFLSVAASEFVELFIGVGAARVRDLFESAAKQRPAVIFIDELDAIGRRRGSGIGYANDEREHTLNQLLVNLDGFQSHEGVVVIAATNRSDILDAALLRPGRFDRRIAVPPLSLAHRLQVLEIHCKGKPLAADVSLAALAERCEGKTGAGLGSLVQYAGQLALRRAREAGSAQVEIGSEDFRRALEPQGQSPQSRDAVDGALIESAYKLTEPVAPASVRVTLIDGATIEGALLWADAVFVKLCRAGLDPADPASGALLQKGQIRLIERLGRDAGAAPAERPRGGAARAGFGR